MTCPLDLGIRSLQQFRRRMLATETRVLFNTELFDFTQGWAYVIGVGVAGRALPRSAAPCDVLPVGRL